MTEEAQLHVRGVDFVLLPTGDFAASVRFYGETLALERAVYRPEHNYAEFETGNLTLMILDPPGRSDGERKGRGGVALHVDDVAESRALLEERGIAFRGETMDTGSCHQAFFTDPGGNMLILHHRYAPRAPAAQTGASEPSLQRKLTLT